MASAKVGAVTSGNGKKVSQMSNDDLRKFASKGKKNGKGKDRQTAIRELTKRGVSLE